MTDQERVLIEAAQRKLQTRKAQVPARRVSAVPQRKQSRPRLSASGIGRAEWLTDEGAFLGDFYSYLRRRVPILSNGIAAWVDLSTSGARVQLEGGTESEQAEAQEILDALDHRVYEFDFCEGLGLSVLMESFYLGFYTNGRFAAEIVPFADLSGIAYVALVDPFTIEFARRGDQVFLVERGPDDRVRRLPSERVFYSAFDPDYKHPQGVSLLDSITWVVEIKEKLIEDMARSSHNAGYPRLHVQVAPPDPLPGESAQSFQARRNTEFDDTEEKLRDLDVDDNLVTSSTVEVEVLGSGPQTDFNWSINLEKVSDEVVTGLRLYAWVLGMSHSTTKNWVDSQHDLLMQRVQRGTVHGARFMDWIRNTELRLAGSPVRACQHYQPLRDPGRLIQERAERFRYDRVDLMVNRGYISKDEGARMLGLRQAFTPD